MSSIRLILWDQLSESISSLKGYNPDTDVIFMCEVDSEVTYVKHHKKKITFLLSAMRHFAKLLKQKCYNIEYTKLDNPSNTGSLKSEVKRIIYKYNFDRIIVTHPGEYRVLEDIKSLEDELNIHIEIREDDRFLCTADEFASWVSSRKEIRMEYFYRKMRKKYKILMDGENPTGGQWNFDAENRKPPKKGLTLPHHYIAEIDDITQEVISLVSNQFNNYFGDIEPFYFAVTRAHALKALNQFIEQRLPNFGDYQDAMIQGEPWMYHSHISFYLNCGLLLPLECVQVAEKAYYQKKSPS